MLATLVAGFLGGTSSSGVGSLDLNLDESTLKQWDLEISFLGWSILNLFTLGIGSLWLNPYVEVSRAAFYREVSGTSYVQDAPQVTLEY